MPGVRVLVGTRKGAFVLTSDEGRRQWQVDGPHFGGWEVLHVKGSPVDPDLVWAAPSGGWFGQLIQRSQDGGRSWDPVGNEFRYDGVPGTHQWYDGTPHPWEFAKVWHLEPSLTDRDTVHAGVEDAALFKTTDGGTSWQELSGTARARHRLVLAAGRRRALPAHDPAAPDRRAADLRRDQRRGRLPHRRRRQELAADQPRAALGGDPGRRRRGRALRAPAGDAPVAARHAVHAEALGRHAHRRRGRLLARGERQPAQRLRLPHRRPRPRARDGLRRADPERLHPLPPDGRLRVYRSRTGGDEWEPLTRGLPQEHCYVNVLRDAMAVDRLDECGVYFGTTGGQVYASPDGGDSWSAIVRDLPAVLSVEVQTLP
jgi:photosystem II stability/assembly factor-like uncharacterized protein